jgi:hypothetical protein
MDILGGCYVGKYNITFCNSGCRVITRGFNTEDANLHWAGFDG